jgi:hypothetical protein
LSRIEHQGVYVLPRAAVAAVALAMLVTTAACGEVDQGTNSDPGQVDAVKPPEVGACRLLTPTDVTRPTNATTTVGCTETHTAETYAVGPLPAEFTDAAYNEPDLAAFGYRTCSEKLMEFLRTDESTVMRTLVNWAWFRPSEKAWAEGARWYRCDVVGGGPESKTYRSLPDSARGLLSQPSDEWMVCVDGESVDGSEKIACKEPHTWRAVTTIKLGLPEDSYPGDTTVQEKTSDFCEDSVGAWLGYPVNYDFSYTWYREAEWTVGNRRSVCWAQTEK